MIIYPAMDLMQGRVVRLAQGRFDTQTHYAADPAVAMRTFANAGAEWLHVVDLDGARAGHPVQHELIAALAGERLLKLQVGGGLRQRDEIAMLLRAGVERVIIGSLAVKDPELVDEWFEEFGAERIVLSLDVRVQNELPIVAVSGWTEASGLSLWDVAGRFPTARHLLLTDIGRDGMLAGPNFELLSEAKRRLPHLRIQASGGVSSLEDLQRLQTDGAIIGKALWEGRMTIEEALSCARV